MKDRSNLEMAKNLTSYTLIFIVADAILLFMAKLLGHGFIYVIAYFLFLLGPMPFVVVVVTALAFAHKSRVEDEERGAVIFTMLGVAELAVLLVAVLTGVIMLNNGFLSK
ncbi:hypothetical protein [Aminicella lysinilytica]|jgi:hypothetical protein|uniref:hypothetical protein n=1 Tax=Aminicella lysinilytica TaxID=433323 RepID=UPI0026ED7BB2|nr:hypothetical protein [Aminicella lysinilytica]